MAMLAIIRVRGNFGVKPAPKKTLRTLGLFTVNSCRLITDSPSTKGMIEVIKDYATWGEVSEKMVLALLTKRGYVGSFKLSSKKKPEEIAKLAKEAMSGKKFADLGIPCNFGLTPPQKGYQRGTKQRLPAGELGPRKDIEQLLSRMI
jgi:large subunit ribosomal protein L30